MKDLPPEVSASASIPLIPDHEVLRVIGRGAYGEIWLARSLTGAFRAVKVVYRTTFESERAFQREFQGMSSFEPISRAHPGFVDILHVGRTSLPAVGTRAVTAGASSYAWWMYCVIAAFALIVAEWWTWQRRITV